MRSPTTPLPMPAGLGARTAPTYDEKAKPGTAQPDFPTPQQVAEKSARVAAEKQQEWADERARLQDAVARAKSDRSAVQRREQLDKEVTKRLKARLYRQAADALVAEAEQALETHLGKNNRRGGIQF